MYRSRLLARFIINLLFLVAPTLNSLQQILPKPPTEPSEPFITLEMVHDDARLNSRVTVEAGYITIGELLEQISAQTGIKTTAAERDGSADSHVAVFVKDISLWRVLNGLWSVMSYKEGHWSWERSGQPGSFSYRLSQPIAARRLKEKISGRILDAIESNSTILMDAVDGTDEQKLEALRKVYGSPEWDTRLHAFSEERLWADAAAFKHALTPNQRRAVLRDGAQIHFRFDSLGQKERDFILSQWKEATKDNHYYSATGQEIPAPLPNDVWFERNMYGGTTPTARFVVPDVPTPPAFGGLQLNRAYRTMMKASWTLNSDSGDDPSSSHKVVLSKGNTASPEKDVTVQGAGSQVNQVVFQQGTFRDLFAKMLGDVSKGANLPLIARLPEDQTQVFMDPVDGKTVKEVWDTFWNRPFMTKWHDGVALVSAMDWPFQDSPVPLTFVRQLRKHAKPGAFLPFEDLTTAADLLTKNQLMRLAPEFPMMLPVVAAQGPLALLHRHPRLAEQALSEQGLPLTPEVVAVLRPLPSLGTLVDDPRARFLTVRVLSSETPGGPSRELIFMIRDQQHKQLGGIGFKDVVMPERKKPAQP